MAEKMIPYGRQWVEPDDIESVVEVLRSDWLTTGPRVGEFERAFSEYTGTTESVALSSGTAALHTAMYAVGVAPGDEVIVPAMTFAATANSVVFQGGIPVFVDVDRESLLIDPAQVESKVTSRTKAIIAVDYCGQPCDYDALRAIADGHHLPLVADACHALGGRYNGRPVGSLADLSTFSFHPTKNITSGEGGMVTTNDRHAAERMRQFRNHGLTRDSHAREQAGSWVYEMVDLGYNYRLSDLHCALGMSQLKKLPAWVIRRQQLARLYDSAFADMKTLQPLAVRAGVSHSYHLYVVQLDLTELQTTRELVFSALRNLGVGVNVHYIPVHLHPYYRKRFGTGPGLCPVAEKAYECMLSLPIFPRMTKDDIDGVIRAVTSVLRSS